MHAERNGDEGGVSLVRSLHLNKHSLGLMDGYLACSGAGDHLVKGLAMFLNPSIFFTPDLTSHLSPDSKALSIS